MLLLLSTSLIEYIELSSVIAVFIIISCGYLSYRISSRRPLYYNLYVVEMHTWTTRRMVQVLHLGQEFMPPITWDRLVQRMRARAPRIQGEERMAISDTNIVIQSPNTVIDSPAPARSPDVDLITLWDIEMPPPGAGHVPDATRDSQYAAAAAIAILARGDDATLMSRVLQNNRERTPENSIEIAPIFEERRIGPSRLDYVTTDVTYTTPSLNPNMHHQVTTTTSNVTQTQPPRNETIGPLPDDDDDDDQPTYESDYDDDGSSVVVIDGSLWEGEYQGAIEVEDSEMIVPLPPTEEEREVIERQEEEEKAEREARDARETEVTVLEGPSEGKVLIRLKFMNDTEKDTYASLRDTVAKFKVDHFTNLANEVIRLIYRGQLLREDHRTLESYGLHEGCIMHCHISMTPYSTPGVATLAPIVNESAPRRRIRRSQRAPRDPTPTPPHGIHPVMERTMNEDFARRRAAQDRNVGQIYLLLSTMVPILSGIGLAFFRPDRIRDLLRPATLLTISQWVCNLLVDNGLLEQDDDEPDSHYQASTLFWIFGGQMVAVSAFLYYFPDVFHRLGLAIFCIFCLYFVFVVYSRQRRREPDAQTQNEMIENQIVQESISLI